MEDKRIPVIIDTDPGVDDAIAIMIAAASEKINLVGITPVAGNVLAEHTHQNALNLMEFMQLDVPVAKGSYNQLVQDFGRISSAHGVTGMGGVELPKSTRELVDMRAWDFIYEKAKEYEGELEVIAIGPLTNLAKAFIVHDDLPRYLKRIVIMGGSVERGNVTPYAEFNFIADAPAAKVVFKSGVPIVMAGLNVTLKTGISYSFLADLAERSDSRISRLFNELAHGYKDSKKNKEGEAAAVIHDAIAVAYVIDPTKCDTEEYNITINTDRFMQGEWGRSVPSKEGEMNCTVITDIDMDYYRSLYVQTAEHFKDLV